MVGACWRHESPNAAGHRDFIADIGSVSGQTVGDLDSAIAGSLDTAVVMPDDEGTVVITDAKASVRVNV